MRLRNIPRAEGTIQSHQAAIKRPEDQKGCWKQVFGNENPIYIEIGMGKGRFLLNMAKQYPDINFIGIERYSSVLLRALEKYDTEEFQELTNIRFVCMDAKELSEVFAKGEVERIYLNFSVSMAEGTTCKEKTDFYRIFCPVMTRSLQKTGQWSLRRITQSCLIFRWSRSENMDGQYSAIHTTCIIMKR